MSRIIHVHTAPSPGQIGDVFLPDGFKVLGLGHGVFGDFVFWTESEQAPRAEHLYQFTLYPTAAVVQDGWTHAGTIQIVGGYVWHLYYRKA